MKPAIICICGPDKIRNQKIIEKLCSYYPVGTFTCSVTAALKPHIEVSDERETARLIAEIQKHKEVDDKSYLFILPHMESWVSIQRRHGTSMFNIFVNSDNEAVLQNFKLQYGDNLKRECEQYLVRASRQRAFFQENIPAFQSFVDGLLMNDEEAALDIQDELRNKGVVMT